MKKILLLISLCSLSNLVFAQDIDYLEPVSYWKDAVSTAVIHEAGDRIANKYDVWARIVLDKNSPAIRINYIKGVDKSGCLNRVLTGGQAKECRVSFAKANNNGTASASIVWVNVDDSNKSHGSYHSRLVEKS